MDAVSHISVLSTTTILYYVLSAVVSPPLLRRCPWLCCPVNGRGGHGHLLKHFKSRDAVLGHFIHSLTVSSLSALVLIVYWSDMKALAESRIAVVATEIPLAFWATELCDDLVRNPRELLKNKLALLHHANALVCLVIAVWYGGIMLEIAMIRLLSQFSAVLLILRLLLLDFGKSDTFLYLLTFSAMISTFFLTRIALIPWCWMRTWEWAIEAGSMAAVVGTVVVASLSIDVLNFIWLRLMLKTYWKYFPVRYSILKKF